MTVPYGGAAVTADWIVEYVACAQDAPEFDDAPVGETKSVLP